MAEGYPGDVCDACGQAAWALLRQEGVLIVACDYCDRWLCERCWGEGPRFTEPEMCGSCSDCYEAVLTVERMRRDGKL